MKAVLYFLLSINWVILISAYEEDINSLDEIDPVIDMLLNEEYDSPKDIPNDIRKKDQEETVDAAPILYPDGIWRCGRCADVGKMKVLYSEAYDHETNYDNYDDNFNMEVQIGVSLKNMLCITLEAEEEMDVRLVSGACSGEQATLGLLRATHCVISVYG